MADGEIVTSGTHVISGVTETGDFVYGSGTIFVTSNNGVASGIAIHTTISGGGTQIIADGGVDSGAEISAGGLEIVSAGGLASGTIVSVGGTLEVFSGATIDTITLQSGGIFAVASGYVQNDQNNLTAADGTI